MGKGRVAVAAEKLRFQKGDWVAIGIVILLAVMVGLCFLPRRTDSEIVAQIYQNGELVKTISLSEDTTFTLTGAYTNTITVAQGKISVTESDCPGSDCVHSGAIGTPGCTIVCLPNAVEIRIVAAEADVDFVVG